MITNRKNTFLLCALSYACLVACNKETTNTISGLDPLQYVDPFIGTGGYGHTFPGATTPFGMVQLSPDTHLYGWDASSGYHYSDSTIYGFSHIHLSGTGIGDMGDVLFLPYTGKHTTPLAATFDKANEYASPGYYEVLFSNYKIRAELTASPRVGFHRYTYEAGDERMLMIDLGHALQSNWGHKNTDGSLEFINDRQIKGYVATSGWAYDHKVYFHVEFSTSFEIIDITRKGRSLDGPKVTGDSLKVFLHFPSTGSPVVQAKVGISSVSEAGALRNMESEIVGWHFEKVKKDAGQLWERELRRIQVKSKDSSLMKTFYTALYHANMAPTLFQDVDGQYLGMNRSVYQADPGYTNYTVFSLWDIFRAWYPLMTIINEDRAADWGNALLKKHEQGGILPKWPLAANYTGTMVGYPAAAIFADAMAKGLTGLNDSLVLASVVHSATYQQELGLAEPRGRRVSPLHLYYLERYGFIPADSVPSSVSYGLECAYYDWCIAKIAELSGNKKAAQKFETRSKGYEWYFDPENNLMRARLDQERWRTPFSPVHSDFNGDFVEGNSWQWSWFVPHDIPGLIHLMGDTTGFIRQLDALFEADSGLEGEDIPKDISGLIGQYAHGNEPSHHIPHLYNYVGQPWKTQERVDQILLDFYKPTADGIIGNEDCGQMSAWFVMNAMGFYQVCPGVPEYSIGRPLFDEVIIPLKDAKYFKVKAHNVSRENKYVKRILLNGKELESPFFTHEDIRQGGTLELYMAAEHE